MLNKKPIQNKIVSEMNFISNLLYFFYSYDYSGSEIELKTITSVWVDFYVFKDCLYWGDFPLPEIDLELACEMVLQTEICDWVNSNSSYSFLFL